MKLLLAALGLLFVHAYPICSLAAQNASHYEPQKFFSVVELQKDLAVLQQHLQAIHPGLYTYFTKAELEARFAGLHSAIDTPMTESQFYSLVGLLSEDIADAHTEIERSEAFYAYLQHEAAVFPLCMSLVDSQLYVTHNFSRQEDILPGDKIVRINGYPADSVFFHISRYVSRDGQNFSSPKQALTGLFGQFPNYYAAIYGFPLVFRLLLERPDGSQQEVDCEAVPYQTQFDKYEAVKSYKSVKNKGLLHLKIEDDVAFLTLSSFHEGEIRNRGQKFAKFFARAFAQIKKTGVEYLIMDVRGNRGGSDEVVIDLLRYLLNEPFVMYRELSTITTHIPDHHYYQEQEELPALEQWAKENLVQQGDKYLLQNEVGRTLTRPSPNNFKGMLYVLINGKSHSATGDLSGLLKQHQRAIFVGEEAGGNPVQNTAGATLTLVLPNSQLNVIVPTTLYCMQVDFPNTGHGVLPDYPYQSSIDELLQQKDGMLEYVLALIKK